MRFQKISTNQLDGVGRGLAAQVRTADNTNGEARTHLRRSCPAY